MKCDVNFCVSKVLLLVAFFCACLIFYEVFAFLKVFPRVKAIQKEDVLVIMDIIRIIITNRCALSAG